jgi:hypothetical protein
VVRRTSSSLSSFDFEGNSKDTFARLVPHYDLDSRVDVSFETVLRRPNMLFDIKQFVDAHDSLRAIAVFDNSVRLPSS